MPNLSQTDSGKAWEYGLALQCAEMFNLHAQLAANSPRNRSEEAYNRLSTRDRRLVDRAANEAAIFLRAHDERLVDAQRVVLQSNIQGQHGDVRDILIQTSNETVGISAKHRHDALKHSRLSGSIDFGLLWYEVPCSATYWQTVFPVFDSLRDMQGKEWSDLPDKHDSYYRPILGAFIEEIKTNACPSKMLRYLLGRYDFYKVIKENGNVSLQSFNIEGALRWGSRVPLSTAIVQLGMKPGSNTTAILHMDNGWQISFRIHNANSTIEPSLKFDVRLVGSPQVLSRHEIPFCED